MKKYEFDSKPITKAEFKALQPFYGKVSKDDPSQRFDCFSGGMRLADGLYHGVLKFTDLGKPDTLAASFNFQEHLPLGK